MLRPIVRYGDPVLQKPAHPVTEFNADLDQLINDMIDTMYAAPGIGLAAPQVGDQRRVCVIDLSVGRKEGDLIVVVNPEFVTREGMQVENEGCLSLPGFDVPVLRPSRVVVKGLTRTGEPLTIEGTGLLARAFQHEIDHLDGMLFVDRLRGLKRDMILRRIHKLQRSGKW